MLESNMLREESPKDQQKHLREFGRYEKFWRRVLIDVLEWSAGDYTRFAAHMKEELYSRGGFSFFRDAAHKYVSRALLPEELRREFQGGDAIFSGYLLMKTLAGDWSKINKFVIVLLTSKQADFGIKSCLSGLYELRSLDAHVKNKKEVSTGEGLSPSNFLEPMMLP